MSDDIKQKLFELENRHKELDENIAWGYSFYLDDANLSKMKKEKLFVKEEIEKLRAIPA
jgi:hypothetical protein